MTDRSNASDGGMSGLETGRLVGSSAEIGLTPQNGIDAITAFIEAHGAEVYECEVTGCNHWNGDRRPMWSFQGVRMPLYRWVCLAVNDEVIHIGDDRVARHKCDNERCFAAEHLHWGTRSENNGDRAL
ncbi:hypothetical protein VCRA2123O444_250057 [Vibrio crassostreae]|uniref:hypothetical protein n=1 Tax=Vibrio crassostreae TaxID=246167 RepID=UPI001B30F8CB|nr:hypothetical protein [Vibrio crassostreae]CAK1907516.1 hypothetical protein VCRA2113O416_220057 [Vibrio crassostreae]CAK1914431.1 hypothetical protein VCRA2118O429_220058 [Vibrio crassostreae]CAK1916187.1 hypothetical protein VCRA2117O428_230057 [Vibrio crassostreae]CAK1916502.1 hypothetical protein VCRA2119O432_230032 [Vibrio crassostreae]CAK1919357.1 hypothetical protein VCRA2113O413_230057 [Vibrio crassostreae]